MPFAVKCGRADFRRFGYRRPMGSAFHCCEGERIAGDLEDGFSGLFRGWALG